jgi:hypothetical protein
MPHVRQHMRGARMQFNQLSSKSCHAFQGERITLCLAKRAPLNPAIYRYGPLETQAVGKSLKPLNRKILSRLRSQAKAICPVPCLEQKRKCLRLCATPCQDGQGGFDRSTGRMSKAYSVQKPYSDYLISGLHANISSCSCAWEPRK